MSNIFKDLEALKKSALSKQKELDKNAPEYQESSEKLAVIEKMMAFIMNGNWTSEKTRKRLVYALRKGYEAASVHYETTVDSIKSSVSQANVRIKERLGMPHYNICTLIDDGKIEEASYLIDLFTTDNGTSIDRLFPSEVTAEFPAEYAIKKVKKTDLYDALITLRTISINEVLSRLSAINPDVVSTICALMHSTDPKHL